MLVRRLRGVLGDGVEDWVEIDRVVRVLEKVQSDAYDIWLVDSSISRQL
jgi:hypothetical protein